MTLDEYRSELNRLLSEIRAANTITEPVSHDFAIMFALTQRKVGMIQAEIEEVDAMSAPYDLAYRFAELLRALDNVGAPIPYVGEIGD